MQITKREFRQSKRTKNKSIILMRLFSTLSPLSPSSLLWPSIFVRHDDIKKFHKSFWFTISKHETPHDQ